MGTHRAPQLSNANCKDMDINKNAEGNGKASLCSFNGKINSVFRAANSEKCFLVALDVYFVVTFIRTTMLQKVIPSAVLAAVAVFALIVFVIQFLHKLPSTTPEGRILELVTLALLMVPAFTNGSRAPLYFGLMAFAAKGEDLDKILCRYAVIAVACCAATIISAAMGFIFNVGTQRDSGTYYAWGFYYLTEFSAHLISLCLVSIYLIRERLRPWHAVVVLALGILVYEITDSRLSMGTFSLAALSVLLLSVDSLKRLFDWKLIVYIPIVLAALSLVLTIAYSPANSITSALNDALTNRLAYSSKGLWTYGITPFGQPITMQGWGGDQQVWGEQIFYLDCSYINILLRFGAVPLIVVLWLYTRNLQRAQMRGNLVLVACLLLVAVNSFINEHLIDVTYNPFLFALLAAHRDARHLDEHTWFTRLPEMRACHRIYRKIERALNQRHVADYAQSSLTEKCVQNPVVSGGGEECFFDPFVIPFGNGFRMYVSKRSNGTIVAYDSTDGVDWTYCGTCLAGNLSEWDAVVNRCSVLEINGLWLMWYTGQSNGKSAIGVAYSDDGLRFTRTQNGPVLSPELSREGISAMNPSVISNEDGSLRMFYAAGEDYEPDAIWQAVSTDGVAWEKIGCEPTLEADESIGFQDYKVGGPEAHRTRDGSLVLLYIGYQNLDVARICAAYSSDGITWSRVSEPLVTPGPDAWDDCAVYKPSALPLGNGDTAIWYNGRSACKESIGFAVFHGDLFNNANTLTELPSAGSEISEGLQS